MEPAEEIGLRSLLANERVLSLALLVDGEPYAGLLPFAARPDLAGAYVHASKLARHSRGLKPGSAFSALIHESDLGTGDPFQLARVTFQGQVQPIERDGAGYREAREVFLAKLPTGEPMFGLGDFDLYELRFEHGRFVAGFARTIVLTPDAIARLAAKR